MPHFSHTFFKGGFQSECFFSLPNGPPWCFSSPVCQLNSSPFKAVVLQRCAVEGAKELPGWFRSFRNKEFLLFCFIFTSTPPLPRSRCPPPVWFNFDPFLARPTARFIWPNCPFFYREHNSRSCVFFAVSTNWHPLKVTRWPLCLYLERALARVIVFCTTCSLFFLFLLVLISHNLPAFQREATSNRNTPSPSPRSSPVSMCPLDMLLPVCLMQRTSSYFLFELYFDIYYIF